jgi:hypothetical protein
MALLSNGLPRAPACPLPARLHLLYGAVSRLDAARIRKKASEKGLGA